MGYQITSRVPPISTIIGIISAAAGYDISQDELSWLAYRFEYSVVETDLETIIAYTQDGGSYSPKFKGINTVPINREFMYMPHLVLYLPKDSFGAAFFKPCYQLCLGRSQDVATVESIKEVQLRKSLDTSVKGILLPFPVSDDAPKSMIYLPVFMSDSIPRTPKVVKIFHIGDECQRIKNVSVYKEESEEFAVSIFTKEFSILDDAIVGKRETRFYALETAY